MEHRFKINRAGENQEAMGTRTELPSMAVRLIALNSRLETLMPILTPIGVALGFLASPVFVQLKPFVPWFFALMTLSGSLKLRARDLGAAVANPLPVIVFFISAHVLMPLAALAASNLALPGDADTAAGFVLLFSTPTAISSFIWVSMFRGDGALALAIILLDVLAAPFVVPFSTSLLLGTNISIDAAAMASSLVLMIAIPTVIGIALNEATRGAAPKLAGPFLGPVSKLCLILVVSANAAAIAPQVDLGGSKTWMIAAVGILLAALGFSLGRLLGFAPALRGAKARTLVFSVGLRNISAAATLAIAYFPEAAALPAILGMIFQQSLAAVFGRLLLGKPIPKNGGPE